MICAVDADVILKTCTKACLISHAYLDHIVGLLLNVSDDAPQRLWPAQLLGYHLKRLLQLARLVQFWQRWGSARLG